MASVRVMLRLAGIALGAKPSIRPLLCSLAITHSSKTRTRPQTPRGIAHIIATWRV